MHITAVDQFNLPFSRPLRQSSELGTQRETASPVKFAVRAGGEVR